MKNSINKYLVFVFVITISFFGSNYSQAEEGHSKHSGKYKHGSSHGGGNMGHDKHKGKHNGKHKDIYKHILKQADTLGLTDGQVKKISTLRLEFKKKHIRLHADKKIAQLELHALVGEDNLNEDKINKKAEEHADIVRKCTILKTKAMIDAFKVLTKDQRKMVKTSHIHSSHF